LHEGTGEIRVSLSVGDGTIRLTDTSGISLPSGSNDSAAFDVQGPMATVIARLGTLIYRGGPNRNGTDTLTVRGRDLGNTPAPARIDTATVTIRRTPVNDPPVLSVPATASGDEDADIVISTITVTDLDAAGDDLQVTLTTGHGDLRVTDAAGATVSGND